MKLGKREQPDHGTRTSETLQPALPVAVASIAAPPSSVTYVSLPVSAAVMVSIGVMVAPSGPQQRTVKVA